MRTNERGQALLLIVLLISLVVTIVVAVSYRLTTETQLTKSQEESVKALAAADSGADVAMQNLNQSNPPAYQTFKDAGIQLQGIDEQRSTISISSAPKNEFSSPEIPKDEQYIFYLSNYPDFSSPYSGNIVLNFGSDGAGSCSGTRTTPALEVTVLYGANGDSLRKYIIEPCTSGKQITGSGKITPAKSNTTVDTFSYAYNNSGNAINIGSFSQAKVMIVRVLFAKSRIGFGSGGATNLPLQGKTIVSEAIANSGVSSKVVVFQSLPQIPADFFVTTF